MTSFLQLEFGSADLAVRNVFCVVEAWIAIVSEREMHERVNATWEAILHETTWMEPHRRWKNITGPMHAVICVMLELDWKLCGPLDWTSDDRSLRGFFGGGSEP